ncbi:hypothetical protein [Aquimarina sp. 2201CG14-23]|uniref:hypothetical protein n=1 Tax=Aquimarina mycalae TaxID=3040073 RepID=UPI002477F044|nr:hypothetical protein [Aquimarina sp. 2201CG14-23]MDH7444827.1 hypothetical protein [Aquimarina sp. 2201CG14-23]
MKTIHKVNKWSFIITLLLYITVYFGLLAQVLLGLIQIIIALNMLFNWNSFSKKNKIHLGSYFLLVITYGLILLTDIGNTSFILIYLTVVPMSIAAYFVYITYRIKKCQVAIDVKPSFYN